MGRPRLGRAFHAPPPGLRARRAGTRPVHRRRGRRVSLFPRRRHRRISRRVAEGVDGRARYRHQPGPVLRLALRPRRDVGGLAKPSSAARALAAGATNIERVDMIVQTFAAQLGMQNASVDQTVSVVNGWLAKNRA